MPRGRGPRSPLLPRRSLALLVAGMLLLSLGAGSLWAWRTFASSQGFADVVTDMLKEPAVRATVADQIVNALEDQATTAQAAAIARPLLEEVVAEMVATDAFQGIFHAGVRELHSAIVEGRRSRLLVPVDDAAVLVREGLEVVNPGMADAIPDAALTVVVGLSQSAAVDQLLPIASLAGWLAGPLGAAGLACVVLAIRWAPTAGGRWRRPA